jgi:DME family drug/metabolite transporter
LANPIVLLIPPLVWGFTPLFYRYFLDKKSAPTVNFLRTAFASIFLLVPFLVIGLTSSLAYGALSGLLTLAIGDTLFFVSIGMVGASVATPLLYVSTVLIQFIAPSIGEPLSEIHLISAGLIVVAVYLLSRGDHSSIRLKGIAIGLLAAAIESVGQSSIKLATSGGTNPLSIAFSRTSTAAIALGLILLATSRKQDKKDGKLTVRDYSFLAVLSVADIGLAAAVYIYSVGTVGIVISTIVLGVSPLITQLAARYSRRESPSKYDLFAGGLIALAIGITVL